MQSIEILDYPAAHSMDTHWFAVDADGHIAIFDTGEGGPVPEDALRDEDGLDSLFAEIAKEFAHRSIRVDNPGENLLSQLTTLGSIDDIRHSIYKDNVYNIILILESDKIIPQLEVETIDAGYTVRFAGDRSIVYVSQLPLANLQKLIADGKAIVGKLKYSGSDFSLAAQLGLFQYEHNNHALTPYDRTHVPQYPLKLEDLPDRLQSQLIEAGIDRIKFAESELVQPIEHTPCNAWSDTDYWIDIHGVEHTPESKLRNTWNPVNKTWIDEDGVEY